MKLAVIKKEIARYIFLLIGLLIVSFGLVLMIESQVGVAPWDVFHLGLFYRTDILTLGQIMQLTGFMLILFSYLLRVRPTAGTFINMFCIGFFIDLIRSLEIIQTPNIMVLSFLLFTTGVAIMGFGIATYMSANLGAGPRDSLMLALTRISGLNMGLVRMALEIIVLISGFLLGGPLGAGTVIFALSIGFFMQTGFRFYIWLKKTSYYQHFYHYLFASERLEKLKEL